MFNHATSERLRQLRRGRLMVMSETQRLLLLSILIGVFAGLMIVCFHIAIDAVSWLALGSPVGRSEYRTILSPALGAAIAALLIRYVFRAARGSGVNHTKAALYISEGYVPFSTVSGKFLACSISIGSGNSLGPEDPALQMGSGVASLLGRLFRLTKENMRLIAPVGAAAGIAAAFNTPITAVLFVIEEVIASWNAEVLGSIVLAAVSAVVTSRWFLGNDPLFRVPSFELRHPSELFIYALIGVACGILAPLFVRTIARLRIALERLPSWAPPFEPAVAGLMVGAVGFWLPQVMGAGYEAIDSALHNEFSWRFLIALGLAKLVVTLLCFGAGTPGGMFAPTLFIGAMVGGGLGSVVQANWPFPTSVASAYVLVGMGTFFAGVFRAPMTSIFMVFEVSASYVIILPVMIANTISYLLSRQLNPVPFFDLLAKQEGLDLPSLEEQRSHKPSRVEDAMMAGPIPMITPEVTVKSALAKLAESGRTQLLVRCDRGKWCWATRQHLEEASAAGHQEAAIVKSVPLVGLPRVYPDMTLDDALHLLGSNPYLPVLSRADPDQILGSLNLEVIHRVYGIKS